MPKQEAFKIYLTSLKDLAFYADYKNGEIDERLEGGDGQHRGVHRGIA